MINDVCAEVLVSTYGRVVSSHIRRMISSSHNQNVSRVKTVEFFLEVIGVEGNFFVSVQAV